MSSGCGPTINRCGSAPRPTAPNRQRRTSRCPSPPSRSQASRPPTWSRPPLSWRLSWRPPTGLDAASLAGRFRQGRKVERKVHSVLHALRRVGLASRDEQGTTWRLRRVA